MLRRRDRRRARGRGRGMPQQRTSRDGCRDARGCSQPDKPSSSADGIHKSFAITMTLEPDHGLTMLGRTPRWALGCAWLAGV